jgi:hypothetical protein
LLLEPNVSVLNFNTPWPASDFVGLEIGTYVAWTEHDMLSIETVGLSMARSPLVCLVRAYILRVRIEMVIMASAPEVVNMCWPSTHILSLRNLDSCAQHASFCIEVLLSRETRTFLGGSWFSMSGCLVLFFMLLPPPMLILISLRNKSTSLIEPSLFSIVIFQSDCSTLGEIMYPGLVRLVDASVMASSVLVDVGESGAGVGFVLADEVEAPDKSIANVIYKEGSGE